VGVAVFGPLGAHRLSWASPTSAGDEWDDRGPEHGGALADFIRSGKNRTFFTVNSINGQSFYNKSAHRFIAATSK